MVTRIGMISFAHLHAHAYAGCLQQLGDQVDITGIYDDDSERGKKVAQELGKPFIESCDQLLSSVDGVVICSENAKHKDYTIQAANAGKPILCEKPISVSIEDAQAMIGACKKNGVELMIAFPCRFSTVIRRAVQVVKEGHLGKILALKGTNRGTMPGGWFVDKNLSGGGAVLDHTVHVVDVWRWMMESEVSKVYAEVDQRFYPDIQIDDTGLLSLEFDNGVFATLDTSWSRPNEAYPTWGDVTMEILGERGSITLDAFKQKIEVYNNKVKKAQWIPWTDDINFYMVQGFVQMIQEKKSSPVPGQDGLKAMEVALGAYQSVDRGEPVSLPLTP